MAAKGKKCDVIQCATRIADRFINVAELIYPVVPLAIRLWLAEIFFKSGLVKLDSWDTTILLFENEYSVPFVPPVLAAVLATAVELIAPVMLALGLGARVGALMLLVMTAVIEFSYQHSDTHIIWAMFLSVILLQGPGKISVDHLLRRGYLDK